MKIFLKRLSSFLTRDECLCDSTSKNSDLWLREASSISSPIQKISVPQIIYYLFKGFHNFTWYFWLIMWTCVVCWLWHPKIPKSKWIWFGAHVPWTSKLFWVEKYHWDLIYSLRRIWDCRALGLGLDNFTWTRISVTHSRLIVCSLTIVASICWSWVVTTSRPGSCSSSTSLGAARPLSPISPVTMNCKVALVYRRHKPNEF